MNNNISKKIAMAAIFMALSYMGFQFFKISIVTPFGKTAFHLGNTALVLGALLMGGLYGGIAGALGMTIADLTSGYAEYAPQTLIVKFLIALIVSLIAHKIGHIQKQKSKSKILFWCILSLSAGFFFNIIIEPYLQLLIATYVYGLPKQVSQVYSGVAFLTSTTNAIIAIAITTPLYLRLRGTFNKYFYNE